MQNNLHGVHNWSGDLKRQQNTCFRGSQAAFFLLKFSQKLCKQMKGSHSSLSPSQGCALGSAAISSPEDVDAPSSSAELSCSPWCCYSHLQEAEKTQPPKAALLSYH